MSQPPKEHLQEKYKLVLFLLYLYNQATVIEKNTPINIYTTVDKK